MHKRSFTHHFDLVSVITDLFHALKLDKLGREKFLSYLVGAKEKLRTIEYSLKQQSGKGTIDEVDFVAPLSDARRLIEECTSGGWVGFNRAGYGFFGTAVVLEVTLRSLTHSLGDLMIWDIPQDPA